MPDISIKTFKDMKKMLCIYVEKHQKNQITTVPKFFMIFNNDCSTLNLKQKCISNKNNNLISKEYNTFLDSRSHHVQGDNCF